MLLHGITFNMKRNKKLFGYSFDSLNSIAYQKVVLTTKNSFRPQTATHTKKSSNVCDDNSKPRRVNPTNNCDMS